MEDRYQLESLKFAPRYRDWIYSLIKPFLVPVVLDVGAGDGELTKRIGEDFEVFAVEPEEVYRKGLRDKGIDFFGGTLEEFLEKGRRKFGSVLMVNVLEHIEGDTEFLRRIREGLEFENLILFVPAHPLLYSPLDRELGHFRRYTRKEIEEKLRLTGYRTVLVREVNLPGALGWFGLKLLRRKRIGGVFLFNALVPFIRRVERYGTPFGLSILAVAEPDRGVDSPSDLCLSSPFETCLSH